MKSPLKTIGIVLAACIILAAECYLYIAKGVYAAIAFAALSILVAFIIGTLLSPRDTENLFARHKKGTIILTTVAGCLLVISCCLQAELHQGQQGVFTTLFEIVETRLHGQDLFGYYTSQLSLTFITISVMSVLSDKSVIIYWANVSEDRLINPTFSCFAAYTYYSIGATVGAGLGIVLNNPVMFVTFFAANICVLILLTVSMIDVYYGRDTKKKKLAKTLSPHSADKAAYENKILGLEQNLLRAADEKNVVFLKEVYELYISYPEKFDSEIGREFVAVMVSTLDAQTTAPFLRALDRSICDRLNPFPLRTDILTAQGKSLLPVSPPFDTDLWSALGSDRATLFLEQISVTAEGYSSPNAMQFTKILMRRLALEYNVYAAAFVADKLKKGHEIDPDLYFVSDDLTNSIYHPKTADGNSVTFERFEEVFDYIKQTFHHNALLFAGCIRLMDRLLRYGQNWYTVTQLSPLPFIQHWSGEDIDVYDPNAIARLTEILNNKVM